MNNKFYYWNFFLPFQILYLYFCRLSILLIICLHCSSSQYCFQNVSLLYFLPATEAQHLPIERTFLFRPNSLFCLDLLPILFDVIYEWIFSIHQSTDRFKYFFRVDFYVAWKKQPFEDERNNVFFIFVKHVLNSLVFLLLFLFGLSPPLLQNFVDP